MKALLWKDCRLNRTILLVGVVILFGPFAVALSSRIYVDWPVWPAADVWAGLLLATTTYSLYLSQFTLAILGGNTIACERADRSAEFLACLPPSRARILASKALLIAMVAAAVWAVNLFVAQALVPWISPSPTLFFKMQSPTQIAATGALLVGCAWLGSSWLSSPAMATSLGLVSPVVVTMGLHGLSNFVGWPDGEEAFWQWHVRISLTIGALGMLAGTVYYLRRVEP